MLDIEQIHDKCPLEQAENNMLEIIQIHAKRPLEQEVNNMLYIEQYMTNVQ